MTKEEFLAIAEKCFPAFQELNPYANLYDFEKKLVENTRDFAKKVFEKQLGDVPTDRRKKKLC